MSRSPLLALMDQKIMRILRVFLANSSAEFHLQEIAAAAKVPVATVFRIIPKLVALSLITPRLHGKMKFYQLSSQKKNEVARFLGGQP